MVKVSDKNKALAKYLFQNQETFFLMDHYDDDGISHAWLDEDKLAEIIQEFYDELC